MGNKICQLLKLVLLPFIIGGFPILILANGDCGRDFNCFKKALSDCNTGMVKYQINQNIEGMEIKAVAEVSFSKSGNNLCGLGISLSDVESHFDTLTVKKYKESKFSDIEINRLEEGFRKNKQITNNSYKKCVFKAERIGSIFQEVKDLINVRISDDCSDIITTAKESAREEDPEKSLNEIASGPVDKPEQEINTQNSTQPTKIEEAPAAEVPEKSLNEIASGPVDKPEQRINTQHSTQATKIEEAPAATDTNKSSRTETQKKIIDSMNTAIMGPKPSKIYEEKVKKGLSNEQIGQEAFESFFSNLKKCDGNTCEKMTCVNCSKGVLFCAKQGYCMECYSGSAGDCKSGFDCMMGICKKRMTKEDFLKLK